MLSAAGKDAGRRQGGVDLTNLLHGGHKLHHAPNRKDGHINWYDYLAGTDQAVNGHHVQSGRTIQDDVPEAGKHGLEYVAKECFESHAASDTAPRVREVQV